MLKINKNMKNRLLFFVLLFMGILLTGKVMAQEPIKRSTETTLIGGKEYYLHHVKSGQTLYGLSRAYNVTIEEIEMFNPEVKNGLKVGHVLGIPVRPVEEPKVEPVEEPKVEPVKPKVEPVEEPKVEPVKPKVEPVEEPKVEPVKPKMEPVEEPKVEPVKPKEEPVEEPKVEPVKPKEEPVEEPKVEPVKPKEEPVEEPKLEPVKPKEEPVEEPKLEPVKPKEEPIEEPKLEPVKPKEEPVEEPKLEPVKPKEEPVEEPKVEPVKPEKPKLLPKTEIKHDNVVVVGEKTYRVVQPQETLYDIAKECGIDVVEIKGYNPGLTNEPTSGTRIALPNIINENDYIVHHCEKNERVSSLLKRWKVDEGEFRLKNISVGSHVFENQVVLIPIEPVRDFYWIVQDPVEIVEVEEVEELEEIEPEPLPQSMLLDEDLDAIEQCYADPENAMKKYKVAFMVPLYLNEMGKLDVGKEDAPKAQKARSLSFLQYYEGFMMAVRDLEKEGLKLDLKVFDVTDNVSTAERALAEIEGQEYDLIVGPFFGKSFAVIEDYAKSMGITMVNPLSNRESVIVDSPNVVKVKPGNVGLIMSLTALVKNNYPNANVSIVSREKANDSIFLNQLEHHLNFAINDEVVVTSNELLQYARHESERLEMGSRLVPTLEVEGQVYSTNDFKTGSAERVVLPNSVKRYAYSELSSMKSQLSGVRDNVIIAYGDNNVFATQILNSLAKDADRYHITLVCVPDWSKYEKLLVDNLLRMNAIYVSDFFVDYNSDEVRRFVLSFREKYSAEPQQYAFEGYDLGYYFLSAMMRYGSDDLLGCLHCYRPPMMHTQFRFYYRNYLSTSQNDGKENMYWSIYQFDKELIELRPINPFETKTEDVDE